MSFRNKSPIIRMTPHTKNAKADAAPDDTSFGAGAPEIEVTPAMIEAGVDKLSEFDLEQPSREELRRALRAAFVDMLRHRG